jgi:hypothetical protein
MAVVIAASACTELLGIEDGHLVENVPDAGNPDELDAAPVEETTIPADAAPQDAGIKRNPLECTISTHPYARNYCSLATCTTGYLRARVAMRANGDLITQIGEETDDVFSGPRGFGTWRVLDAKGVVLKEGNTATYSIGGKGFGGQAIIHEEPEVSSPMPLDVAKNAAVVEIVANCI